MDYYYFFLNGLLKADHMTVTDERIVDKINFQLYSLI